ncbi:MAG: hypothetical protein ACR2K1_03950 [Saprospiraceae bacterium]
MISRLLFPVVAFLVIGIAGVFCTETFSDEPKIGMFESMPEKSDTFEVVFRDTNFWIEGDSIFCVTGIVDNKRMNWQKIWLRVDMTDAAGSPVSIKGKDALILRAFSEAIPPFGASSFFYTIPLKRLSARPSNCTFSGAAAQNVAEGPILVGGMQSNVKAFSGPDTFANTDDRLESAWLITTDITNPLPLISNHPRLNVLVYGRDQKLWFSQVLNPEDTLTKMVVMQPPAPITGGTSASAFFQVNYGGLPNVLNQTRIGRIDVMLFDARSGSPQSGAVRDSLKNGGQK